MPENDLTELQTGQTNHILTSQVLSAQALENCRNSLEAIQNLRYLILLEVRDSMQVKLHLRMMDWHMHNLSDALFLRDTRSGPDFH